MAGSIVGDMCSPVVAEESEQAELRHERSRRFQATRLQVGILSAPACLLDSLLAEVLEQEAASIFLMISYRRPDPRLGSA